MFCVPERGTSGDGSASGGIGVYEGARAPFGRRGPPASGAPRVSARARRDDRDRQGSGSGSSGARPWGERGWLEGPVQSSLVPPYLRKAKSVEELLPWLYLKGISTGDFSEALASLVGPRRRWIVRLNNHAPKGDLVGRI